MPRIVADAVDVYIVRRVHARLQFLLLQRRGDAALGGSWQPIHGSVRQGESTVDAASRLIEQHTGLTGLDPYSADHINQVYDHTRDAVVLAPVLVFAAGARAQPHLGQEFTEFAWCDREEALGRLTWSGQRWAVRHIDELLGPGGAEAEFYRIG
ncbi:MAG: NUDIX domain-containing protein [Chloroflexota bacterium]